MASLFGSLCIHPVISLFSPACQYDALRAVLVPSFFTVMFKSSTALHVVLVSHVSCVCCDHPAGVEHDVTLQYAYWPAAYVAELALSILPF